MRGQEKEDHWKSFKTAAAATFIATIPIEAANKGDIGWLAGNVFSCLFFYFTLKWMLCYTLLLDSGNNRFQLIYYLLQS